MKKLLIIYLSILLLLCSCALPYKSKWDIADNGIDGVGTIRGNTNGNWAMLFGARAVATENVAYYAEDYYDPALSEWRARVLKVDLQTRVTTCIFTSENSGSYMPGISNLNFFDNKLWFTKERSYPDSMSIYIYDPAEDAIKKFLEADKVNTIVAYGYAFISIFDLDLEVETEGDRVISQRINGWTVKTVVYDAYTLKQKEGMTIDGFEVRQAMDGRLYGVMHGDDGEDFYSMYPDGTDQRSCPEFQIAADGKLYNLQIWFTDDQEDRAYYLDGPEDDYGHRWKDALPFIDQHWYYPGNLHIADAATGKAKTRYIIEIPCSSNFNITHDKIYFRRYGSSDWGDLFAMDLDGQWLSQVHENWFYIGVSILNGVPSFELGIPCDLNKTLEELMESSI